MSPVEAKDKPASQPRRIEITVTQKGFEPAQIDVKKGEPVVLVFTRKTDKTCAKDILVDAGDDRRVSRTLPLDQPVTVEAVFRKSGRLGYACSMDMITGVIAVQ